MQGYQSEKNRMVRVAQTAWRSITLCGSVLALTLPGLTAPSATPTAPSASAATAAPEVPEILARIRKAPPVAELPKGLLDPFASSLKGIPRPKAQATTTPPVMTLFVLPAAPAMISPAMRPIPTLMAQNKPSPLGRHAGWIYSSTGKVSAIFEDSRGAAHIVNVGDQVAGRDVMAITEDYLILRDPSTGLQESFVLTAQPEATSREIALAPSTTVPSDLLPSWGNASGPILEPGPAQRIPPSDDETGISF